MAAAQPARPRLRPRGLLRPRHLHRAADLRAPGPVPRALDRPDPPPHRADASRRRAAGGAAPAPFRHLQPRLHRGRATPTRHAGCWDWWSTRLRTDSYVDVGNGFFTDQRFIDFVPGLFEPYLVKDPSWNVAYWNLATRPLTRGDDGGVLVSGRPLTFVHLSGYSPALPHLLSKHQGTKPRLLLSEDDVLRDSATTTAPACVAAGFESAQTDFVAPFTRHDGVAARPDRPAPGAPRDPGRGVRARAPASAGPTARANRWPIGSTDPIGDETTVPEPRSIPHRGLPPAPGPAAGLPGGRQRRHLAASFPGCGLRHCRDGRPAEVICATTSEHWDVPCVRGRRRRTAGPDLVPGVEVVGYLNADVGLGETARQFVASLEQAGIPLSTTTYDRTLEPQGRALDRPPGHRRASATTPLWSASTPT